MTISFTIDQPPHLPIGYREAFLTLLRNQGQVDNPTMKQIIQSSWLCIAHDGDTPIGIGAIKHVSKSGFRKAKVENLADDFSCELGYLYVEPKRYKGLGIGKSICRFLLRANGGANVFATTAVGKDANAMVYILESLDFEKVGSPYVGDKTGKTLGLFLKYKKTL
jgi:hypothetical protein